MAFGDGTIVRVDEERTIGVKMVKSSSGGKTTYSVRKLPHVSTQLSDTDAYILGEGWAGLTDNAPEDITLTSVCSLQVQE